MKRLIAMALLVLTNSSVFAQESALYTGVHSGFGHIKAGTERERSFGFNWSLGYRFSSGFLADVGLSAQSTDDIFGGGDTLDLNREELMLGYQIRLGDTLRIIPRIGRARWDLDLRDGALIGFSDEDGTVELGEGTGDIAELVFEFRITELAQLDVSYEKLDFRLGEADMSEFGVRFEF